MAASQRTIVLIYGLMKRYLTPDQMTEVIYELSKIEDIYDTVEGLRKLHEYMRD